MHILLSIDTEVDFDIDSDIDLELLRPSRNLDLQEDSAAASKQPPPAPGQLDGYSRGGRNSP